MRRTLAAHLGLRVGATTSSRPDLEGVIRIVRSLAGSHVSLTNGMPPPGDHQLRHCIKSRRKSPFRLTISGKQQYYLSLNFLKAIILSLSCSQQRPALGAASAASGIQE
jgi:hypothetical protein